MKKKAGLELSKKQGAIITIGLLLLYIIYVFNKTLPLAEGWYTEYSYLMNNGQKLYKDIEYLFFPLYPYIIKFITAIFGYNLIVLRLIGVICFLLIGLVSYLLFYEISSPFPALCGACVTAFYMQSEIVQVFYDYVRFMDLFIICQIFFLILSIKSTLEKHAVINKTNKLVQYIIKNKYSILAGLFSGLTILIKQSSGLIVWAYMIFALIVLMYFCADKKKFKIILFNYVLVSVLCIFTMLIFLFFNGTLFDFFELTFSTAINAKGGLVAVLFGGIYRHLIIIRYNIWKISCVFLFLIINYILQKYEKAEENNLKYNNILQILAISFFAISIIICNYSKSIASWIQPFFPTSLTTCSFVIAFGIFVIMGVYLFYSTYKKTYINQAFYILFFLAGAIFAIGYGCFTSGGLSEGQTALGVGFIIVLGLHYCRHKFIYFSQMVLILIVIMISTSSISRKLVYPYSWWGLSVDNIWEQKIETQIPILDNIFMAQDDADMYDEIYSTILKQTSPEDYIFAFPHMPIIYTMTDRHPATKSIVQWFDVSSPKTINNDIEILKQNNPKVIVRCKVADFAVDAHEKYFNKNEMSQLRMMDNFLLSLINEKEYIITNSWDIGNGYELYLYRLP